jgi:hypothetical protein
MAEMINILWAFFEATATLLRTNKDAPVPAKKEFKAQINTEVAVPNLILSVDKL